MNTLEIPGELADDAVREAGELMDRFNQRLRLDNLRLVERYVEGELHLRVRFGIRGIDEEFVADLQRARGIGRGPDRDQVATLDEVVHLVEHSKWVPFPSLVRFGRVRGGDDDGRSDSLYVSAVRGYVFCRVRGIPGDGKSGVASGPCDSDDVRRGVLDMGHVIDRFSRVRIALGPDFVWAGVKEGVDCDIRVRDVLFGPFDFRSDTDQQVDVYGRLT
jgi:hypothetical protein